MIKIDIDKVRQLNDLARDLLRHGLAKSMSEAVVLAEKQLNATGGMINLSDSMSSSSVHHESVSSPPPTPALSVPEMRNELPADLHMIFKTTVAMVNSHADKLTEAEKRIERLTVQLNMMRDELNRMSRSPVEVLKTETHTQAQTTFKPSPTSTISDKPKVNPRSGGYSSDDVNIEKFFYSGPK